jgi:hypothetical protein
VFAPQAASASAPPSTTVPVDDSGEQGSVDDPAGGAAVSSLPTPSTVPADCVIPMPVKATFVGRLAASDSRTARFEVQQIRGGSLEGYSVAGLADVDYGTDVRFLELRESYIVAVGVDATTNRLVSKVRDPEPLYGGSQIIAMDDAGEECPEIEDAVRTLTLDGRSVESGVLAPLKEADGRLLRALLLPALWVFGGLLGLATIRAAVVTLWRWGSRPASRG